MGFFQLSELAKDKAPASLVPKCGLCGLKDHCKSPKMSPSGEGRKKILVLAEAPGKDEDDKGVQLVGNSGRKVMEILQKFGVNMRRDCWLTNALICFTGDTKIESPSPIRKAFRRTYHGPLIRIRTFDGRVITGTPNHPILTTNGWVHLGLLKEGQDLVCGAVGQRSTFSGANVQNPPAKFEELFRSLTKFGHVKRVVGSSMDFHGDGENGNVDVITSDSLLTDGVQPSFFQHGCQSPLKTPDELPSYFFGQSRRFSDSTHFSRGAFSSPNCIMGGFRESHSSRPANFCESHNQCFAPVSDGDFQPYENVFQLTKRNSVGNSQGFQSFPGEITLDRIVNIEVKASDQFFSGDDASKRPCHVYNLETEQGYYLADGIIVSNCRPPNNEITDRRWVDYCRPNLVNTLNELNPEIIIPLGGVAVESLLKYIWKEAGEKWAITRWNGWRIPCQKMNTWICPTYHPSYVLREKSKVLEKIFEEQIGAAVALKGRPFTTIPDYKKEIDCVLDSGEAARLIRKIITKGGSAAFDYETNMLKPDSRQGEIISCAICWQGKKTIAYPWHGEAITATREFLRSPILKIAQNMKFEDRWSRAKLGTRVRNWDWDTMLAAHVIDNRRGITSIKFQAFTQLGVESWNDHIEPYLKAKGGGSYEPNRILDISLRDLLYYNGLDALLEYKVMKLQKPQLGVE